MLSVLTDGRRNTTFDLTVHTTFGRLLLRGQLSTAYIRTSVFLEIEGGNVTFFHGQTECKTTPSSLMSHVGPYCGVPSKCHYGGVIETSDDIETHQFTCQCTHASCRELVLWIWPESLQRNPRIREIRVFPWFCYVTKVKLRVKNYSFINQRIGTCGHNLNLELSISNTCLNKPTKRNVPTTSHW